MAIDDASLTRLARAQAEGMTSIRGRRVVRLIRREFAGAAEVVCLPLDGGGRALLGISPAGAALCATDGRGPEASLVRWHHGEPHGLKTGFSLLKDSLPATREEAVTLVGLPLVQVGLLAAGQPTPAQALQAEVQAACLALGLQRRRPDSSPAGAAPPAGA